MIAPEPEEMTDSIDDPTIWKLCEDCGRLVPIGHQCYGERYPPQLRRLSLIAARALWLRTVRKWAR